MVGRDRRKGETLSKQGKGEKEGKDSQDLIRDQVFTEMYQGVLNKLG